MCSETKNYIHVYSMKLDICHSCLLLTLCTGEFEEEANFIMYLRASTDFDEQTD